MPRSPHADEVQLITHIRVKLYRWPSSSAMASASSWRAASCSCIYPDSPAAGTRRSVAGRQDKGGGRSRRLRNSQRTVAIAAIRILPRDRRAGGATREGGGAAVRVPRRRCRSIRYLVVPAPVPAVVPAVPVPVTTVVVVATPVVAVMVVVATAVAVGGVRRENLGNSHRGSPFPFGGRTLPDTSPLLWLSLPVAERFPPSGNC